MLHPSRTVIPVCTLYAGQAGLEQGYKRTKKHIMEIPMDETGNDAL
jgi:hypothetical protein